MQTCNRQVSKNGAGSLSVRESQGHKRRLQTKLIHAVNLARQTPNEAEIHFLVKATDAQGLLSNIYENSNSVNNFVLRS